MRNGLYGQRRLCAFYKETIEGHRYGQILQCQKGCDFIGQDTGGPDVSVYISTVERAGMRDLNEGQRVSFDVQADRRSGKSAAANLRAA